MSDLADYLVVDYLVVAGGSLAAGASVILFVGWLVSGCYRSPIARQRFAEWTLLAALLWLLVLPLLPMQPSDWLPVHYLPSARTFITQPESRRQEMPVARLHGETPADSNSVQSIDGLMQPSPVTNQQESAAIMSVPAPIEVALPSVQVENRGNRVTTVSGLSAGWFGFDGRDKRFLLRIYLVGTLMALGWLAFGHVALAQLVRRSRRPQSWLIQLMESLKPTTMPRILISDRCPRVITFGWWRPTIMLPTHIAHKENRSQLRHVMLHELGHIRQRDAIGQWLLNMAFVLFYGHILLVAAPPDLFPTRVGHRRLGCPSDKQAHVRFGHDRSGEISPFSGIGGIVPGRRRGQLPPQSVLPENQNARATQAAIEIEKVPRLGGRARDIDIDNAGPDRRLDRSADGAGSGQANRETS